MKKYRIFLLAILTMVICSMSNFVDASLTTEQINLDSAILDENSIVINSDYSVEQLGNVINSTPDVKYFGDFSADSVDHRTYTMYEVNSTNASITSRYKYIGYVNSGENKGQRVGADMTISDLKMGNGSKNYVTSAQPDHKAIGFNKFYMGFILFEGNSEDGILHRGSVAKITVKFFLADNDGNPLETNPDGTVKYMNVGSLYMGIGGFGSEKWISDNTLGAPQWEWASFDNVQGTTIGLHDKDALIREYPVGWSGTATDNDPNEKNYGWGVAPGYSFTDVPTSNVTGRNIISNGGNRFVELLEVMADDLETKLRDYETYRMRIRKGFWMFNVPNITDNYGNRISQFQFEFGKSFGTVELGLKPVLLANHFPAKPEKNVDKTIVHENEKLKYTITQRTGFLQSNSESQTEFDNANTVVKYNSMSITDNVPGEVTYDRNSIVVKRKAHNCENNHSSHYLSESTLINGQDYTITYNTNSFTISFTQNYLKNKMAYVGEEYEISFNATVNDLTYAQAKTLADAGSYKIFTANNKATTIINGKSVNTNPVKTQIIYDILTKAENASISGMITEIKGGESNKQVIFTPELGYYIDTVEWQTQAERYAPSTPELSNVTDIPNENKVTIPEEKNGIENTYKHETTIRGINPNLPEGNQQTNITEEKKENLNYDPFGITTFTFNNVDNNHYIKVVAQPMKMVIDVSKEDVETQKVTQGDAKFENAIYTVYENYDGTDYRGLSSPVTTIILDSNGNGSSIELPFNKVDENGPYGEYYVFETTTPEGYLRDFNVYTVKYTAQQQTVARQKVSHRSISSEESVKKSNINIIKSLDKQPSTDSDPAFGCELYLTLNSSNGKKVYTAVIDQYGYASFNDIPYGWYTITESEEARNKGYKLMDPEPVYIQFDATREENQEENTYYYRIIEENPIETHVRVLKEDAESNQRIPVANTEYKIWDYKNDKYVEMVTESGRVTNFKTNNKGYFITPQKLKVGKYKLVELNPPQGYRPADMEFEVKDGVYENIETIPTITINQKDTPQKGKIVVNKIAEVMTGVTQTRDDTTGKEILKPVYEKKGLKGVTYKITAAEDIVTGDGIVHMHKGDEITITTDENGIATSDWLYLGKYTLREAATPVGYVLNSEVKDITLDYRTEGRDEEGRLVVSQDYTVESSYTNERVKLNLEFEKKYGTTDFNNINDSQRNRVKFGVYAAEDIKSYNGAVAIPKNSLLEVVSVKDGKAEVTVDLPVGKYYVQELEVANLPFELDTRKYEFEFKPNSTQEVGKVEINNGRPILNPLVMANPRFLKINSKVYNSHKEEIDKIIANNDLNALDELAQEFGLEGAEYQVYFKDENNEYQKLQSKLENGDWKDVIFVSNQNGLDIDESLPVGTYYLKEIKAPIDYEIDPNFVEVNVSDKVAIAVVHDPKIQGRITIIHKDVDTGEEIYPREKSEDDIDEPYTTVERTDEINESLNLHFDAYELVEEKYPDNAEGYYEKEEQIIVYYYKKVMSNVIVKYLDVDTLEEISYGFEYIDYIGEDYDTFAKEIPGYELVIEMLPGNAEGQYTRDTIEVIYYYRKLPVDTSDINLEVVLGIVTISLIGIVTILRRKSLN